MPTAMYGSQHVAQANLLSLVSVQENAVVTKPLYEGDGVRLVVFAMDAGQVLSPHRASMPALVHVVDGRIIMEIGGEDRELAAHDWLAMPAEELHAVRALAPSRFLLTLIRAAAE